MKIKGNTVGFPNPQPDWSQVDTTQADYIKNKPDVRVDDQGYTVIGGQRGIGSITVIQAGDTSVSVQCTLKDSDQTSVHKINLDADGHPYEILVDGESIPVTWSVWGGGSDA